jgi:hypothetical protein
LRIGRRAAGRIEVARSKVRLNDTEIPLATARA